MTRSISVIIIAIGFCFIPASIVGFVVRERETKAKHQQMISGTLSWCYWEEIRVDLDRVCGVCEAKPH